MSDLGVTTAFEGDRCLIVVSGEARLETAERFEHVTREVAVAGTRAVLVDMTQLVFMDSASAGMLLRLRNQLQSQDGVLVLFGMRKLVSRLFERTGLAEQFTCVETQAEAEALLG